MALRKKHRETEVSTDSLSDIMFFLMLFFLILSTMVSPNAIKVALPKSTVTDQVNNAVRPIHVAITKDKKYFVNSTEVSKETLEPQIASISNTLIEPTVIMHLDKDLAIQDEIDIMTICYKLKCKTILATAPTNK